MIRLAVACLFAGGIAYGADDALRFVDGIPLGGPKPVASAMEWTVGHYTGAANAELFAEGKARRLEYVVNLAGRRGAVAWADRVVMQAPGRTPATCIVLSDGDPDRRAATVETWYAEGEVAAGAASFALGIDASSKAFSQRARSDLPPQRAAPLGQVRLFSGEIDGVVTGSMRDGRLQPRFDAWSAFLVAGPPARIVASQQRSLRLMNKVAGQANALPGRWACLVVSGFPAADSADPGTMPFVAWRWTAPAGERLLLVQAYLGDAEPVTRLGVAVLHEDGATVERRGESWTWNGADWTAASAWNGTSPAAPVVVGGKP